MKKKPNLWLSRIKVQSTFSLYRLWTKKPVFKPHKQGYKDYSHNIESFCPFDFEKYTGLKLKPGEVKKVKSIKIVLGE